MRKKLLTVVLCGVLVLGLTTGCDKSKNFQDSTQEKTENKSNSKEKELKNETFKVGNYNVKYGVYKSDKTSITIKKDGTIWVQSGIYLDYHVEGNHIIATDGTTKVKYRVDNEDSLINDTWDEDYDTLYYAYPLAD